MPDPEILKLYYSIGEVSRLTGLDAHVLRYWETEFKELSPRKNRGGKRLYRESDINRLLQIKELLYDKRYTIEGARMALRDGTHENVVSDNNEISGELVQSIKDSLMEIKKIIEE